MVMNCQTNSPTTESHPQLVATATQETTCLLDRHTYSFAVQEPYQVRHTACITGIGKGPKSQNAEGVIHMGDAKRGFSGTSVCEVNAA